MELPSPKGKASAAKAAAAAPLALKDAAGSLSRCKSQQEKRAFYYKVYLLDPEVSAKVVAKKDTQEEDDNETVQKGWFTDDEVAQFKGILPQNENYSKLKEAACHGCPERDHEDENLAALGVRQYYYEHRVAKSSSSKKRLLELEEEVDEVAAEDFEEIRKKLKGEPTQKPAKGSGGQPLAQVLPEQLYKEQHKRTTSMLSQVCSELTGMDSLVVTLKKKKHDMGPVALGQVEKLQGTFQELETAIIEDLQNYPKDPKDQAKDLVDGICDICKKTADLSASNKSTSDRGVLQLWRNVQARQVSPCF